MYRVRLVTLAATIIITVGCHADFDTATVPAQPRLAPAIQGEAWLNGPPPSTDGKVVVVDAWASW